jgi:hypothetical protein
VDNSTPLKTVYIGGWFHHTISEEELIKQGGGSVEVPIPDGAQESAGADAQIVIWNIDSGDEWGFYHASENANGSWNVTNGYYYNTKWSAVSHRPFIPRGAGVPYLAGLTRPWEISQGQIDHALAFGYDYPANEFVYPATSTDGLGTFPPDLPEGARLQLDPTLTDSDFDTWGLDSVGKIIAHALQDYGMIVVDNSGRPKLYMEYEGTAGWGGILNSNTVDPIPLSAFRVLDLNGPYPGTPYPTRKIKIVSSGDPWLYNETDPQPPSSPQWYEEGFDDSEWSMGWTPFGYGDSVTYGTVLNDNDAGYFFRKTFTIDPDLKLVQVTLKISSDNCHQVYLNGVLIDDDLGENHEYQYWNREIVLEDDIYNIGENTLAVYVYNTPSSGDAFMDLEIVLDVALENSLFLYSGWNLISIPYIQSEQDLETVLFYINGDFDLVEWYDSTDSNDPWKHHTMDKPFGNDLFVLNETMGFWVHITQPGLTVFNFNGVEPSVNQTIMLYKGWNLVGYPSLSNHSRTIGLNNLEFGIDIDAVQWFDGETKEWHFMGPDDPFAPGSGYWIHSVVDTSWEVPLY